MQNMTTIGGVSGPRFRQVWPSSRQIPSMFSGSRRFATSLLTARNAAPILRMGGVLSSLVSRFVIRPLHHGRRTRPSQALSHYFFDLCALSFTAFRSDPKPSPQVL